MTQYSESLDAVVSGLQSSRTEGLTSTGQRNVSGNMALTSCGLRKRKRICSVFLSSLRM